ncbi:MAG: toxin-antitoxin (TA) system antitoxin [Candidatus Electrothrix sp. MAN1_4]|nr:toxin-antitoxin (TA) system antitoxin [Candidatus Electrothrix sp. MAN1_4]
MVTRTVDIQSVQPTLEQVLADVRQGDSITFTDGNMPLARIIPLTPFPGGRTPELHSGAVETMEDFDEPLSDEFWPGEGA